MKNSSNIIPFIKHYITVAYGVSGNFASCETNIFILQRLLSCRYSVFNLLSVM